MFYCLSLVFQQQSDTPHNNSHLCTAISFSDPPSHWAIQHFAISFSCMPSHWAIQRFQLVACLQPDWKPAHQQLGSPVEIEQSCPLALGVTVTDQQLSTTVWCNRDWPRAVHYCLVWPPLTKSCPLLFGVTATDQELSTTVWCDRHWPTEDLPVVLGEDTGDPNTWVGRLWQREDRVDMKKAPSCRGVIHLRPSQDKTLSSHTPNKPVVQINWLTVATHITWMVEKHPYYVWKWDYKPTGASL